MKDKNEQKSHLICQTCVKELNAAFLFRQQILKSEQFFVTEAKKAPLKKSPLKKAVPVVRAEKAPQNPSAKVSPAKAEKNLQESNAPEDFEETIPAGVILRASPNIAKAGKTTKKPKHAIVKNSKSSPETKIKASPKVEPVALKSKPEKVVSKLEKSSPKKKPEATETKDNRNGNLTSAQKIVKATLVSEEDQAGARSKRNRKISSKLLESSEPEAKRIKKMMS